MERIKHLYILDLDKKLNNKFISEIEGINDYNIIIYYDIPNFKYRLEHSTFEDVFAIYSVNNIIRSQWEYTLASKDKKQISLIHYTSKKYLHVKISNSILKGNSIVGDFSRIEDSFVGKYCKIERNNLIRDSYIGDYSYTGENVRIFNTNLGKYSCMGWNITIGAHEHNYKRIATFSLMYQDFNKRFKIFDKGLDDFETESETTIIGSDVWIGCHSIIKRGIKIGDGAIIGSGSVVTKDVPPYAIVVGNPGRIIKYRFAKEIINKLLEIKWWNWDLNKIRKNKDIFMKEDLSLDDLQSIL